MFALLKKSFDRERFTGLLLLGCVVASLLVANSPLGKYLFSVIHFQIPVGIGKYSLHKSVEHWVNDGLMAVFFLLAGLEIKREVLHGTLSDIKKGSLPVLAAVGGMLFPALIFTGLNLGEETMRGWAIPMATDIAFAIGIMALARRYVTRELKVFLVALAIVDDIGAIIVIALFYSTTLALNYLFYALVIFGLMLLYNYLNIRHLVLYVINGLIFWYFIYMSGIHATIAGVLTAFAIPYATKDGYKPLAQLEHAIINPVNFIVLPLFAFVNTAIVFNKGMFENVFSSLSLGIFAGLVFGKPLGILAFSYLGIRFKISQQPANTNWKQMAGAGMLAGIGFTMSIFIALLSFSDNMHHNVSKLAILAASTISALGGFLFLKYAAKPKKIVVSKNNAI